MKKWEKDKITNEIKDAKGKEIQDSKKWKEVKRIIHCFFLIPGIFSIPLRNEE